METAKLIAYGVTLSCADKILYWDSRINMWTVERVPMLRGSTSALLHQSADFTKAFERLITG